MPNIENCSTLVTIRKMQTKAIRRYHFILSRMAIIIKIDNKCWEGVENSESSYIAVRKIKWCRHFWKRSCSSSKG